MRPNYLPGDPEPSSSLQSLATTSHQKWSCLVPLQMWGFLLVFWEGESPAPVLPAFLGVCVGERMKGEGGKGYPLLPHTDQESRPQAQLSG